MIKIKIGSIIFAATLIAVLACEKQASTFKQDQLDGRWELSLAKVNGAETDRLRDLYFVFLADTSMQTNILGSERNYKYTFDGEVIAQISDPSINYMLKEINDSTMTVEAEIRGATFTIYLGKAQPTVNREL
ncbi:MAG: hypothetical protein IPL46_00380 [Saprospiraceae bacterium]|nr:hypothetical protein [Saprospiraceae bacterium]